MSGVTEPGRVTIRAAIYVAYCLLSIYTVGDEP